jgi:hypothetical protein
MPEWIFAEEASGEIYALLMADAKRPEESVILEVAGPLAASEVTAENLRAENFGDGPDDMEWANQLDRDWKPLTPPFPGDK